MTLISGLTSRSTGELWDMQGRKHCSNTNNVLSEHKIVSWDSHYYIYYDVLNIKIIVTVIEYNILKAKIS